MQARFYDPLIGRFLSADPVGFMGGGLRYFNRYAYTANDPINAFDPDGKFFSKIGSFFASLGDAVGGFFGGGGGGFFGSIGRGISSGVSALGSFASSALGVFNPIIAPPGTPIPGHTKQEAHDLDPLGLNSKQANVLATAVMNEHIQKKHSQIHNEPWKTGHPYRNLPHAATGAKLPGRPGSGGYESYKVGIPNQISPNNSSVRIVVGKGKEYLTVNHYSSFMVILH
jgi:uncharacterized protein RhaS with RHS repeats